MGLDLHKSSTFTDVLRMLFFRVKLTEMVASFIATGVSLLPTPLLFSFPWPFYSMIYAYSKSTPWSSKREAIHARPHTPHPTFEPRLDAILTESTDKLLREYVLLTRHG